MPQADAPARDSAFRTAWYWLPVFVYAGLIFFLSSLPHPEELAPTLFEIAGDKAIHVVEYGVLGILCYRAFRFAGGSYGAQYALRLAILAASLYGLSDETHQAFVPNRQSSGWDALADFVGATLASLGWRWKIEP